MECHDCVWVPHCTMAAPRLSMIANGARIRGTCVPKEIAPNSPLLYAHHIVHTHPSRTYLSADALESHIYAV
eukprot:scaffold22177_cov31-Tisochrysis_lutea.AAC.1